MTLSYDLYWSFRSPYSYLIVPRLLEIEAAYDVRCNVRPVYPLAVKTPEFFDTSDPLWGPYLFRDTTREAEYLGLPYRWPRPDPVRMVDGNYRVEQPYIHRLTHLGVAAAEQGRGLPFLREVSHVIWSGEVDDWHEGDHLQAATERAGLDYATLSSAVDADPNHYTAIVEQSQAEQRNAGHWGVPMMVFADEPFFGQDRVDQLVWRMKQHGLVASSNGAAWVTFRQARTSPVAGEQVSDNHTYRRIATLPAPPSMTRRRRWKRRSTGCWRAARPTGRDRVDAAGRRSAG